MPKLRFDVEQLAKTYHDRPEEFMFYLDRKFSIYSPLDKANTLLVIGNDFRERELYELCLILFQKALRIFKLLKIEQSMADCYNNIGIAFRNLGNLENALSHYHLAMQIDVKHENLRGISRSHNNIGVVYYEMGNFEASKLSYGRAIKIDRKLNDMVGVGIGAMNYAMCEGMLGNLKESASGYEQAIEVFKSISRKKSLARCLVNLGNTYYLMGAFEESKKTIEKALVLSDELESRQIKAKCLLGLGACLAEQGKYRKCIEYYRQAVKINRKLNHPSSLSKALDNLGRAYHFIGNEQKAIKYTLRAIELAKVVGNKSSEALARGNLANCYLRLNDFRKAEENYKLAQTLNQIVGNKSMNITLTVNLAIMYLESGNYESAKDKLLEAISLNEKFVKSPSKKATAYSNLGEVQLKLGAFEKAYDYQVKALIIANKIGDLNLQHKIYLVLVEWAWMKGDYKLALNYAQKGFDIAKAIMNDFVEESHQISFLESLSENYYYQIFFSLYFNEIVKAYNYLEESKSQVFISVLSTLDFRPKNDSSDRIEALLSREANLLDKLKIVQSRHLHNDTDLADGIDIDDIRIKLKKVYSEMEAIDGEYVNLRKGKSLNFDSVKMYL